MKQLNQETNEQVRGGFDRLLVILGLQPDGIKLSLLHRLIALTSIEVGFPEPIYFQKNLHLCRKCSHISITFLIYTCLLSTATGMPSDVSIRRRWYNYNQRLLETAIVTQKKLRDLFLAGKYSLPLMNLNANVFGDVLNTLMGLYHLSIRFRKISIFSNAMRLA